MRSAGHEQGAASLLIGAAANQSIASGQPVDLDDLLHLKPAALRLSELMDEVQQRWTRASQAGGIRLLVVEFLPWHRWQKAAIAATAGIGFAVGLLFLLGLAA